MRTEHGISTPLGNFLYACTDLLNNMAGMARMQTMEIAKRSGYEGIVDEKPAPIVCPFIDDEPEFDRQLEIVKSSAKAIPALVNCVFKIVSEFHEAAKTNAAAANFDDKIINAQGVSYWGCANITDARWSAERELCKLNAKVAELHVASHAVFKGVELRLCCRQHPCEEGGTYVFNAPVPVKEPPSTTQPPSKQTPPPAQGKPSA